MRVHSYLMGFACLCTGPSKSVVDKGCYYSGCALYGSEVLQWVVIPCRAILASHSEYFRARVSTNWTAANAIQHEGRQVIIEQVEPDMVGQAACRAAANMPIKRPWLAAVTASSL
jgi:hypothetical protein